MANAERAAREVMPELPVRFSTRDATASAREAGREPSPDLVVLDPPRTGAREVMREIASLLPRHVVYVSCDAATLARDAAILVNAGWMLVSAEPLALFPQTAHFETVATFSR